MESLGNYNFAEKSKEKLLKLGSFNGDGDDDELRGNKYSCFASMINFWKYLVDFGGKAWEMGRSDPRKFIFAVKMGLALSVVSLLMFWKESYHDVDQYSIWAILTVIVMFEFSIGATFIKGFNRGLGTLFAGILACCFSQLAFLAGHQWEGPIIISSIFIIGFLASYLKLYPTMKPYEYGFRVFILTYCILMAAGNRTGKYTEAVVTRLVLIGVGAAVCLVVNICICPIWSGEDLHNLVVKNFKGVAISLEGCVNGYLNCVEYKKIPSKILTYEAAEDPLYKGYRAVVESKTQEQNLAFMVDGNLKELVLTLFINVCILSQLDFAIWEPPHGPYRMCNYPWKSYVKVSGALRHCAFLVMALHGCILSEIQAPAERRRVFLDELQRVGAEGAKVLRQLGNKVEKMEKLGHGDILEEVHKAAEQLQKKIDHRSYLLVNSESWEINTRHMQLEEPESLLDSNESVKMQLGYKSLSETVLDMRSTPYAATSDQSAENLFTKQASWPFRVSFDKEDKFKTYESASALSLATFASLLIEFVARLQNVVDSFEELCEKAEFKEPILNTLPTKTRSGFWPRLICCLRFKR